MVLTGSEWGLCVSDVIFSFIACDTSRNLGSDEEVDKDSHMRDGWSPQEVSGVCASVTSFFHISLVKPLVTWEVKRNQIGIVT
jgi:hypothetical protein